MKKNVFIAVALALLASTAFAATLEPLALVPTLDPQRYIGRWYEIARFQHSFEKSIVGATADYALRPDGKISVKNSGFKNTLDGKFTEAKGVAWIPDPSKPSALKVQFFWPFAADYLVFGLDQENYQWAVVGANNRKYLWFLSRTPTIDPALLDQMKQLALSQGYDLSGLYMVPQKER